MQVLLPVSVTGFASSTKMGWKEGDDRPATTNSGTGSMHYGSTLTIDNLKLDYAF